MERHNVCPAIRFPNKCEQAYAGTNYLIGQYKHPKKHPMLGTASIHRFLSRLFPHLLQKFFHYITLILMVPPS